MKLEEYMDLHRFGKAEFAKYLNISRMSLDRYLKGKAPTIFVAARIHRRTKGEISLKDLGIE